MDKIAVLREAPGDRQAELETNILIFDVTVPKDRRGAAAAYLAGLGEQLGQFTVDGEITVEDLLDSPYLMFGTEEQIADQLRRIRDETGGSYIGVFPTAWKPSRPSSTG